MNPYIYLGGAILAEVIGTTLMKFSEGFTVMAPLLAHYLLLCIILVISSDAGLYTYRDCLCYLVRSRYRSD